MAVLVARSILYTTLGDRLLIAALTVKLRMSGKVSLIAAVCPKGVLVSQVVAGRADSILGQLPRYLPQQIACDHKSEQKAVVVVDKRAHYLNQPITLSRERPATIQSFPDTQFMSGNGSLCVLIQLKIHLQGETDGEFAIRICDFHSRDAGEVVASADRPGIHSSVLVRNLSGIRLEVRRVVADHDARRARCRQR